MTTNLQVDWGYTIMCSVLRSIESINWNDMKPQLVQGLYDTRNVNIWLRWDITVFHLCAEFSHSEEIMYHMNEWRKIQNIYVFYLLQGHFWF